MIWLALLIGCKPPAPSATTDPPPQSDALYFVLVDRFADGADQGFAIDPDDPQAWHGGDLSGITAHVDHLQRLGVAGVWLSPITDARDDKIDAKAAERPRSEGQSPEDGGVGGFDEERVEQLAESGEEEAWGAFHGYWVEDLGAVEPRLGTLDGAKHLAAALKAADIDLYLDMVYNHVAYDHPWTTEHPDWFHGNGDVQDWDDPVQVVTHDVHGLPDLAQENEAVYAELLAASRYWVEALDPAGFRVDAVRHLPEGFLKRMGDDLGDLALLGEVFEGDPVTLNARYEADQLEAVFDFPLHYAMKDVFCEDRPVGRIAATLSADIAYGDVLYETPPGALSPLVTFVDNHDVSRIASACKDTEDVHQVLAFWLSARGTPVITWGTEIGLTGAEEPDNRKDMRWGGDPLAHPTGSVIVDLLQLRAAHPVLQRGRTRIRAMTDDWLLMERYGLGTTALIGVNRGENGVVLDLPTDVSGLSVAGRWEVHEGLRATDDTTVKGRSTQFVVLDGIVVRPPPDPVSLTLEVVGEAPDGALVLTGSGDRFGNWNPAEAPRAVDGQVTVQALPGEVLATKWVVLPEEGEPGWAPGDDRFVLVPDQPSTIGIPWTEPL